MYNLDPSAAALLREAAELLRNDGSLIAIANRLQNAAGQARCDGHGELADSIQGIANRFDFSHRQGRLGDLEDWARDCESAASQLPGASEG
jgi:hypothetical protein